MGAIFRHELRNYFHSLTAYVFGAFLLAVIGIGAMYYNLEAAVSNFEFVLSFASIIFVVIVPILTMRTLAEERRQRTDQLLYSLPITTTQVVLGKYLALLVVYLILLAVISLYPLLFSRFGDVYSVIMPIALGLIVDDSADGTVTELLTTSGTSFSKVTGYAMTTYDYEDGDIDGPFATGVSVRPGDGEMVWFTSSYFLEDAYNASSSGANGDLVMNALADMIGESEAMAIRSKSLNYDYLSISSSTASLLKVLMIGAFPLAYLGIGVGIVLTRRRKQNEAV